MIPQELPEMVLQVIMWLLIIAVIIGIFRLAVLMYEYHEDEKLFRDLNRRTMIREVIDEEKTVLYRQIEELIIESTIDIMDQLKSYLGEKK